MRELPDATLNALLKRIGQQDAQALKTLYAHYHGRVYAFVMHKHARHADAEEITNDVFKVLAQNPAAFRGQSRFSSWLMAIASHRVIDLWRKQGRRPLYESDEDVPVCAVADPSGDPLSQALEREEHVALDICRDALPIEQKEAIYLAYYEDASAAEIAQRQQCPVGTVKSRLFKARQKLQQCLERWK
jgi:RNA polymerase sigma-70 factor (ECF subfamily)